MAALKKKSAQILKMEYPVNSKQISEAIKKGELKAVLGHPNSMDEKKLQADFNRFSARYRLAKSFNGINLLRYDKLTMDTYSAIMRIFLAYNAFELFLKVMPKKDLDKDNNLYLLLNESFKNKDSEIKKIANKIIAFGDENGILSAIEDKLKEGITPANLKRLQFFLSGKGDYYKHVLISAEIIRHNFAHGHLTANIKNHSRKKTIQLSKLIVDNLLFKIMDTQFSNLKFNAP